MNEGDHSLEIKMRGLVVFGFIVLLINGTLGAMTEKQMKAALKLVRNTCQPKNKATDEDIDKMHKGDWEVDKTARCYMACILTMYKLLLKDNSFDWEGGLKTLEAQAPPSIAGPASKSVINCKDSVKTLGDRCEAGFEIAKCVYFDDPEHYFLP